jgi:hypothetical protein
MRGMAWRLVGPAAGALAALVLLFAAAAAAAAPLRTYGPTRDWPGTQIRSLAPVPRLPVAPGGSSTEARVSSARLPDQVLSNEFTYTQWAYVARGAWVYASPSLFARRITRLQWYTESGFPEPYVMLRAHWDDRGREWVEVRIPGRPNGRVGWVLRGALGRAHVNHQAVVVNRENLRLYFYDNGHLVWSAPVGVGKPSTPTPAGHFWITELFVITNPSSGYYPYAYGTSDYSTLSEWPEGGVVGIHGPYYAPASAIPGRISHGCIRLRVPDDFWLGHHLQVGAPLLVK